MIVMKKKRMRKHPMKKLSPMKKPRPMTRI
jgi:hypothetical protein